MSSNDTPRIVLVAGQSNMVGYRTVRKDLPPRWRKALPNCLYWTGNGWSALQAGQLKQRSAFGPELTLAQRFASHGEGPVGIVKVARNGSYIERHWSPDIKDGLFSRLIEQAQSALGHQPSRLCGMIWLQGEADCIEEEDANLYRVRFTRLIQTVRLALSAPSLPVIAGIVNPPEDRCAYRSKVRRAIKRAPLSHYSTVRMDDLELREDSLHLSAKGLHVIGKRFANKLLEHPHSKNVTHWIWKTDKYQCWYSGPADIPKKVIVSFPFAVTGSGFDELGFGQAAFEKRDVGTIYIRSNRSNWFQHEEVMDLAWRIREYVEDDVTFILYGASMGAYAALLLSGVLKPKRIVAIAPQFSIDRTIVPWETRWFRSAKRIQRFRFDLGENIDPHSEKLVCYDNMSLDKRHIDMLPIDETWSLVRLPYASHQVLRYLRETDCLSNLVDYLTGRSFDVAEVMERARRNRRKSPIYWMTLAKNNKERRPQLARTAFLEAISHGGPRRKIMKHVKMLDPSHT